MLISCSLPSDHLEQLSRAVSTVTVDPYKSIVYYFFPKIGAYFNNYQALRQDDPSLEAMMPRAFVSPMLEEVQLLTRCAQIERPVVPYIALNFHFAHCGGSYSLNDPALFIPEQHFFRRAGASPFPQERAEEGLAERPWVLSDHQVRFLLCRELGQIKQNSLMLRLAIKIEILAALFATFVLGWLTACVLWIGALGLYVIAERYFEARADLLGAQILGRRLRNPAKAKQIAIATLEKLRLQNLSRRENSWIARVYITGSGNNLLDFTHPFLTTRIARLQ